MSSEPENFLLATIPAVSPFSMDGPFRASVVPMRRRVPTFELVFFRLKHSFDENQLTWPCHSRVLIGICYSLLLSERLLTYAPNGSPEQVYLGVLLTQAGLKDVQVMRRTCLRLLTQECHRTFLPLNSHYLMNRQNKTSPPSGIIRS